MNAQHTKNVPGRKSDVQECQWLLKLHTFGLLNNSFQPTDEIRVARALWRQRGNLVADASSAIQRIQKVLIEMNVQLSNVLSDISGVSGMPKFPDITQAYARTFHDQKEMKIDVWLASHAAQFNMHKKYQPGDAYNPDRFVDPQGFQASVAQLEKLYRDQLAKEQEGK